MNGPQFRHHVRMTIYRALHRYGIERWLLPRWMSENRLHEEAEDSVESARMPPRSAGKPRAWFHAASVGELESLVPVVLKWAEGGGECVVTILSESARGSLRRLRMDLEKYPHTLVHSGFSPWEGRWQSSLEASRPDQFVTAKYEAWPELWWSLARLEIPLLIVSAKARRSLKIGKTMSRMLGGRLPKLRLLTVSAEDAAPLREILDSETLEIIEVGEPRWDRVQARATQGNVRARELIQRFEGLPRPWGVLGSVWPEDMQLWRGRMAVGGGTLWVVPHQVDEENVRKISESLSAAGLRVARTSRGQDELSAVPVDCVLVDEVGALLELYADADWAFVGGGFGISMHSTIEPALFGVPVSCGPKGRDQFPEIRELESTGQLTLVHDGVELGRWLEKILSLSRSEIDAQRDRWKSQAQDRLGATDRVLEIMSRDSLS
jgi:3-deoxy-D-manno-octulosonic-acid transferase